MHTLGAGRYPFVDPAGPRHDRFSVLALRLCLAVSHHHFIYSSPLRSSNHASTKTPTKSPPKPPQAAGDLRPAAIIPFPPPIKALSISPWQLPLTLPR
jgi:hypothetical protein